MSSSEARSLCRFAKASADYVTQSKFPFLLECIKPPAQIVSYSTIIFDLTKYRFDSLASFLLF